VNQRVADVRLITLFHNAEQAATAAFAQVKDDLNITLIQALILQSISHEPSSQWAIVQTTGVDRSTLSDVVRRLEKSGLVTRERDEEDARRMICSITEKGRELATGAALTLQSAIDKLLAPIPANKRNVFLSDLRAFVLGPEESTGSQA
jgi:DNA-binding MarR family transcriptional regulator